jgi:hypothetical protein
MSKISYICVPDGKVPVLSESKPVLPENVYFLQGHHQCDPYPSIWYVHRHEEVFL